MVDSSRYGEYFGEYDEMGCNLESFGKYLQECDIDTQFTISFTPQQNEIER